MKKYLLALLVGVLMVFMLVGIVAADSPFPSTNDENRDLGWAHFNVLDTDFGEVTVEFVSTRGFYSCFEYRSDGDTSQATSEDHFSDGLYPGYDFDLYPYTCVNNSTKEVTLQANEYVEIRMIFGAEKDERFDWTPVGTLSKDDCKDGGWEDLGYVNQGQCIKDYNDPTP